jgi:hypothetical protein
MLASVTYHLMFLPLILILIICAPHPPSCLLAALMSPSTWQVQPAVLVPPPPPCIDLTELTDSEDEGGKRFRWCRRINDGGNQPAYGAGGRPIGAAAVGPVHAGRRAPSPWQTVALQLVSLGNEAGDEDASMVAEDLGLEIARALRRSMPNASRVSEQGDRSSHSRCLALEPPTMFQLSW